MDHINPHISTNIQRQKLSIAVFNAASFDPSHERLDGALFPYKNATKIKNTPGSRDFGEVFTLKPETLPCCHILDVFIGQAISRCASTFQKSVS